jgi:hypothetical protein
MQFPSVSLEMQFYIVVENGEPYPEAYKTFAKAVAAVKEKNREAIEDQINDIRRLEEIEHILANVNTPEGVKQTHLYVEKGINITIYKMSID